MNAAERIASTLTARRTRDNAWIARCPAHEDRSPSLSITYIDGRVLVHCFAGCELSDILKALGMTSAAELYDDMCVIPDLAQQRRAQAARELEKWSETFLGIVCRTLRHLDEEIRFATSTIQGFEDGKFDRSAETETDSWNLLGKCVLLKQQCEEYFDILNGTDLHAKLELWRTVKK